MLFAFQRDLLRAMRCSFPGLLMLQMYQLHHELGVQEQIYCYNYTVRTLYLHSPSLYVVHYSLFWFCLI